MCSTIRFMRWVFLMLYVTIISGLFLLILKEPNVDESVRFLVMAGIFIFAQVVFLLGAGAGDFCKPFRKRRLLLPVLSAAFMMSVLVGGLSIALMELFKCGNDWIVYFWLAVVASWLLWAVIFFIYTRKAERYVAVKRLVSAVLCGSWLELLITIPSHIIVSRRPGCFVGFQTGLGVAAGLVVMLWSFGPGIGLLFLKEIRQAEMNGKTVRFVGGLQKSVFWTIVLLSLLAGICLGISFLINTEIEEAQILEGYFLSLAGVLILIVSTIIVTIKKIGGGGLLRLGWSLLLPGLIFICLSYAFNPILTSTEGIDDTGTLVYLYFSKVQLAGLWPALVLILLYFFLLTKTLKRDCSQDGSIKRHFVLLSVASVCIGTSFVTRAEHLREAVIISAKRETAGSTAKAKTLVEHTLKLEDKNGNMLEIVSFEPSLPATLKLNERLHIKVRYKLSSADEVQIWARPYTGGSRTRGYGAHPSSLYRKKDKDSDTIDYWFGFSQAAVVDEVRIQMNDSKANKDIIVLRCGIEAKWVDK